MSYDTYVWMYLWFAKVITANILSFRLGCFNTWMTFGVFAISKVSNLNKAISQNDIYKQTRNIQHKDYLVYCLIIGTFRCTLCKAIALIFIPLLHWTKNPQIPTSCFYLQWLHGQWAFSPLSNDYSSVVIYQLQCWSASMEKRNTWLDVDIFAPFPM